MFSAHEIRASPPCMFAYIPVATSQQFSAERRVALEEAWLTKRRTTRLPTNLTISLGALVVIILHGSEASSDLCLGSCQ